jgi:hypothetical protein
LIKNKNATHPESDKGRGECHMETTGHLIFEQINGLTISAEPGRISVSTNLATGEWPVMSLRGSPEECSLHNKTAPSTDTSALHFSKYGFVHIPNNVADRLVSLGVRDDRESD